MQAAANEAFTALLPILVSLLVSVATLALHKLRQKLDGQVSNDLLDRVANVADLTVLHVEKTVVRKLRELSEDGTLSAGDLFIVRDAAYKTFSSFMGTQGMKALETHAKSKADVEALVQRHIDAQLELSEKS